MTTKIEKVLRKAITKKTLHYRIFCKYCERPFEDNMNGEEKFVNVTIEMREDDLNYQSGMHLNCHWCNNYAVFVDSDTNEVRESCRGIDRGRHYFDHKSKELMDAPPKWQLEWKEPR